MEISANSFDFDDLFPGSPEAGYFFPSIEKDFSNPYTPYNFVIVVFGLNLATWRQEFYLSEAPSPLYVFVWGGKAIL
jgi:hypothetical protein